MIATCSSIDVANVDRLVEVISAHVSITNLHQYLADQSFDFGEYVRKGLPAIGYCIPIAEDLFTLNR